MLDVKCQTSRRKGKAKRGEINSTDRVVIILFKIIIYNVYVQHFVDVNLAWRTSGLLSLVVRERTCAELGVGGGSLDGSIAPLMPALRVQPLGPVLIQRILTAGRTGWCCPTEQC